MSKIFSKYLRLRTKKNKKKKEFTESNPTCWALAFFNVFCLCHPDGKKGQLIETPG